jgi:hypothetical protein
MLRGSAAQLYCGRMHEALGGQAERLLASARPPGKCHRLIEQAKRDFQQRVAAGDHHVNLVQVAIPGRLLRMVLKNRSPAISITDEDISQFTDCVEIIYAVSEDAIPATECDGPTPWLLVDVRGQVVVSLWPRVGQCRGVVVVLEIGAGLPVPVLPEVLFPAGDAE